MGPTRRKAVASWPEEMPASAPRAILFWTYVMKMFSGGSLTLATGSAALALLAVIGLQLVPERTSHGIESGIKRLSPLLLAAALAALILIVGATVPSQGVPPFIYSRF